jgi:GNAT superfamily N-acetyltransferase
LNCIAFHSGKHRIAVRGYENDVVEETLRGTGLGKQIMAGTLQAAWDAGCYKAMLQTGSRRPAAHAFYRACGFSPGAKTAYLARPSAVEA